MRALIMKSFKNPMFVRDFPIPEPAENQVQIKVEAGPINPSDLEYIQGKYGKSASFPQVLGFEGSGVVVKSGGGTYADSLLNKRVAFSTDTGSFAEFCVSKVTSVVPIADKISFNEGACSFVNPLTCVSFFEIAKSQHAKAVVISAAASSLGKMVIRYFQQNGVKVITIVRRQEQVDALKQLGAQYILNSSEDGFKEKLAKISTELEASVFFDAVGGQLTTDVLLAMPNNSTVYVYGLLGGASSTIGPNILVFKNQTIKGFWLPPYLATLKMEQVMGLIKKVQELLNSDLKTEISKESPLQDFQESLEFYEKNMSLGKVLFKPTLLQ